MKENKAIDTALELIDQKGIHEAYGYLVEQKEAIDTGSQYYNFLYCLAALDDKPDEALDYLEEAIVEKELWYRTSVFDDDDLDTIRDSERFKRCVELSEKRYREAILEVETVFTWEEKRSERLVIALHGNQQNLNDSKEEWSFLEKHNYQVEYLQSEEIDSANLYRWEDNGTGPEQLSQAVASMPYESYEETVLCGFSAGCNTLLRGLLENEITCTTLILHSPWIPMIEKSLAKLASKIKAKNINVLIMCGTEDEDCFDLSKALYEGLLKESCKVNKHWVHGMAHEFASDHETLVLGLLR